MAHTVTVLGNDYSIATVIAGILLTVFVGLVVIGGIKRISKVSEVVVPFMAVLYVVLCLIIVFTNIKQCREHLLKLSAVHLTEVRWQAELWEV